MTSVTGPNRLVVRVSNEHRTAELWIKKDKAATRWTRRAFQTSGYNSVGEKMRSKQTQFAEEDTQKEEGN